MSDELPTMASHRGSALLLCLMLLVAFTLLGTSLASSQQLQQRVQTNQSRDDEALRSANAALAQAERWLFNRTAEQPPACAQACSPDNPVWSASQLPERVERMDESWWEENAQTTNIETGEARWLLIELQAPKPVAEPSQVPTKFYRALAMGSDANQTVRAVVESLIVRPWVALDDSFALPAGSIITSFCRAWGVDPCGRVVWRQLR